MDKISIKDIAKNLTHKTNKSFNTDLFKSDSEIIDEPIQVYLDELELYISVDYNTITDINGEIIGQSETFIAYNKGETFLLTTQEKQGYKGEIEETIYSKWLTLQGYNYFSKKFILENPNTDENDNDIIKEISKEFYNSQLAQGLHLEIDFSDILEIGEFKENYYQVSFVLNDEIIKINFNLNYQLTSFSRSGQTKTQEKKPLFQKRGNKY